MTPYLEHLHPYPFEKLKQLLADTNPAKAYPSVRLSIGEPKHPTPEFILEAYQKASFAISYYPETKGSVPLRQSISKWLTNRHHLPEVNPDTQILPVNGTREALFSFAQCVIDNTSQPAYVVCPNPFYQIYEGAAILAGAKPLLINHAPENNFKLDFHSLSDKQWQQTQLVYICSPSNPTGYVLTLEDWKILFELADRFDFIIASDECYSEIYTQDPPLGALSAAHQLGRNHFDRLVVFSSLSKRSNIPGIRSGFVAGEDQLIKKYLHYRTYHGCAMSPAVQETSIAAWSDENHVIKNRLLYQEKFSIFSKKLGPYSVVKTPPGTFYLWFKTEIDDRIFSKELYTHFNITVLPGQFLSRAVDGYDPGKNFVRIALVDTVEECLKAADRFVDFFKIES